MNEKLLELLSQEEYMPFDIKTITKDELMSDKIFEYLITIDNSFRRDDLINKLESKARDFKCEVKFRKKLNLYFKRSFNSGKLTHNEVADQLLQENSIVTYENTLHIYNKGYYISDRKFIEKKIIDIFPEAKINFMNEVYRNLELKTADSNVEIDKESRNYKL